MRAIVLAYLIVFLNACSTPPSSIVPPKQVIVVENNCSTVAPYLPVFITKKKELTPRWISQNPQDYITNLELNDINISQNNYENSYFTPWNIKDPKTIKLNILWALELYNTQNSYGENFQKRDKIFFDNMREKINLKEYLTVNKEALTLKALNIRALPTNKPLLLDPEKAGEGFPFDYLQNSTIAPNKPLLITHYSKDKAWAHVVSSFAYGWVRSDNIAIIKKEQTQLWQKAKQIFITKDNTPLYSKDGEFLYKAKLGMMLPLIKETNDVYIVLAIAKYKMQKPLFVEVAISKQDAHRGINSFNNKTVLSALEQLSLSKYGWGGIYSQRDCSSTLRDFFAPFGIWLPRNSYQQSKVGTVINLEGLSDSEKITLIKVRAIPYRTLLYKQGHIVLYVGTDKDRIIVFQNMWGIKTKEEGKEGRYIIGKALFSTLNFGNNLDSYDDNSSIIHNLKSMNILF